MTDELYFTQDTIQRALHLLADHLSPPTGPRHVAIVVGGSFLALHDLREATRDIDTITRTDAALRTAINDVARSHGLPEHWLNDHAAAFRPQGLTTEDCTVALDHPALLVLIPAPKWVFTMKLYAGRAIDHADLVKLWPLTGFTTPNEAARFYQDAYPAAPDDPYLTDYIAEIAATEPRTHQSKQAPETGA